MIVKDAGNSGRWNGRISITVTLTASIFLLVLISVGSVLWIGLWLAQKNTFELLSENAHQGVSSSVERIRAHLEPAQHQAQFVARQVEAGELDTNDRKLLSTTLMAALAAAPQINSVIHIRPDLQALLATRNWEGPGVRLLDEDYSKDLIVRQHLLTSPDRPFWTPPIWRQDADETYISFVRRLEVEGASAGAIVSVVAVGELSKFLSTSSTDQAARPFVLYGKHHVLAHKLLEDGFPGRSDESPLPQLSRFTDPVLAQMWQGGKQFPLRLDVPDTTRGHVLRVDDEDYVFLYREIAGFGPEPLYIGAYFPTVEVGDEIRRLLFSLIVGIAALVLALLSAIVLGRRIAKPVVRFSDAASKVQNLNLDDVQPLPGSIFRELNDQARAFNAMLQGLHWFELYVPRKIVDRLVRSGEGRGLASSSRDLVVMFTDIAGFSTISEGMSAEEVAEFVNHHFEAVAACIEEEDGTLDKFIGDSVMAFWGAPDPVESAEVRACRAALSIAAAVRRDNADRVANGKAPVHMRIGIHVGEATVGNIGAPGRVNYTIIGDTVNIGQRLEQLGKEVVGPEDDVVILVSGDVAEQLGEGWLLDPAGSHVLKGRKGTVDVFRLKGRREA